MKSLYPFSDKLKGLTRAITRYPATAAFLLAACVFNAISITSDTDYLKPVLACVVGGVLCAAFQAAYERFFNTRLQRLLLTGGGVLLALFYYFIIRSSPQFGVESRTRTFVALFALLFAYIWLPAIKSRLSFNEGFIAAFKAFFQSALYSTVIFLGCMLIIAAIDTLIFNVSADAYAHTANVVFMLFAPLFFLSLIPVYHGKANPPDQVDAVAIDRATFCPKFLDVLISYIIIPLTAVFTVILLLYIIMNISGAFWSNNLLEPLLVSYAVTVIVVYILCSRLENKFATLFRLVLPKVLVPIVLFQILSSGISLRDSGVTHPRYFAILFGIFAVCAGIVMSTQPVRKNGLIAALLVAFSVVSIIPPVDAFTVSRLSQQGRLKAVLFENGMLKNNAITPKSELQDKDKRIISDATEYLYRMAYTDKTGFLPKDFNLYEDFYPTFGFYQNDLPSKDRYINVVLDGALALDISGYDAFARAYVSPDQTAQTVIAQIARPDGYYLLKYQVDAAGSAIVLVDTSGQTLVSLTTDDILARYRTYTEDKTLLTQQDATFTVEGDKARMTVVVQSANINLSDKQAYYHADLYIMVSITS